MLIKYYWKTIIWAIIIAVLSSIPGDDVSKIKILNIPHMDKIAHLGIYFILSFLFFLEAHRNSFAIKTNRKFSIAILFLCVLYGIIMEFLQFFLFQERSAEFLDIIANSTGSVLSLFVFLVLKNRIAN